MPSCVQAIFCVAALCCVAGEAPANPETPPAAVLRVDSSLVLVPVHVTNIFGAPVEGLRRQDFHVIEDRIEQTITSFGMEDAPVSIGFLFDASGSMRSKMKRSVEAAAAFFRTANRADEFFLVEFNDKARLIVPFTLDSGEIRDEITRTRPNGRTTLIDAVYLSLGQMKRARHRRKAIVVLSDGGDNWSRHSARALRSELVESDVQVYAMGIYDPVMRTTEEKNGPQLLDELTSETGGRQYRVSDVDTLPEVAARIGRALRSQYVLGYHSTNPAHDGRYRRVSVQLATPKSRELHTDYRRGYYAPSD